MAVIIGSSLAFIDGTVVNAALPAIQREFDTNVAGAQWVIGIGAALLVPGSLALISAAYLQSERGAAIGTWSAPQSRRRALRCSRCRRSAPTTGQPAQIGQAEVPW